MRRDEALRILAAHRAEIDKFGVRSIAIFGSVARDEAGEASDVDVLVEVRRPFGYFRLLEFQEFLERILSTPVDLFTRDSLRADIRAKVLREAIRAA